MHEGGEGSHSPNDRVQKKNGDGDGQRSRPTSQVDYERTPSENLKQKNPGDGAVSKPESRSSRRDVLRETVDADKLFQELQEKKRGDKTIESEVREEVQALLDKWEAAKRPDANRVTLEMVSRTYPEIRLAAELDKEYDKQAMELGQSLILSKNVKDISDPKMLDAVLRRELGGSMVQIEKEYKILRESFPKKPEEIITRSDVISRESQEKATAMVNEWQTDGWQYANRINEEMVLKYFPAVREATALEKVSNDVTSAREKLQEAQEKFPKNPEEVYYKELQNQERNRPLNILGQYAIEYARRNANNGFNPDTQIDFSSEAVHQRLFGQTTRESNQPPPPSNNRSRFSFKALHQRLFK